MKRVKHIESPFHRGSSSAFISAKKKSCKANANNSVAYLSHFDNLYGQQFKGIDIAYFKSCCCCRCYRQIVHLNKANDSINTNEGKRNKKRQEVVVSKYCEDNFNLTKRYIDPTIGKIDFPNLTRDDIEQCLLAIPARSRKLNEAKRKAQAKNRADRKKRQEAGIDKTTTHYPEFKQIRVASTPTQHKVLVLLNLVGRYALNKGIVQQNVADDEELRRQFPKSKPTIDNFHEDESRYIFSEIKKLPLSAKKVQFQLMFMCGLRPCEMCSLEFDDITLRDPHRGCLHVVNSRKTENAAREIKLDPDTTSLLIDWRASREAYAEQIGVLFENSWLVCSDDGRKVSYNTFRQRWMYFLKHIGVKHHRPYASRHTFATMNARNNVDPKTLSNLMGHASPEFTLRVYTGYLESAGESVVENYRDFLEE